MILWELISKDQILVAWLQQRPHYCDRGRWHGVIEAPHHHGTGDPSPRYYFDLGRAKAEIEEYCRAKKVDINEATWKMQNL